MRRTIATAGLALLLAGCGVIDKVANVGKPPRFSRPTEVPAPAVERSIASSGQAPDRAPNRARNRSPNRALANAPSTDDGFLPESIEPARTASLFRPGSANLFRDARAAARGDILTVRVAVNDKASFDNATSRNRTGKESAGIAGLLGLDKLIDRIVPGKATSAPGVSGDSNSTSSGAGNTTRSESISLTLSAIVTEVLPNGNLAIRGRQEMRVNNELRELVITGLVRPQDIARDNSIRHAQIAEARVSYGGRGQLTDVQQARWGQQIYDALFPF